jgi:DNA-binding transcriptional LysR family regulator
MDGGSAGCEDVLVTPWSAMISANVLARTGAPRCWWNVASRANCGVACHGRWLQLREAQGGSIRNDTCQGRLCDLRTPRSKCAAFGADRDRAIRSRAGRAKPFPDVIGPIRSRDLALTLSQQSTGAPPGRRRHREGGKREARMVAIKLDMTDPALDTIDWDDLRYFARAARARTLSGAARLMRVEHSTVGRRLSSLERSFGAALVVRGPEGLTLTPLGTKMSLLVADVERTVRAMRELVATERTPVRLSLPPGFARFFSSGLSRLRHEHPEISLELMSSTRPPDFKKSEADLAISSELTGDSDVITRKLCELECSLYASESYLARRSPPVRLDDLAGHDVVAHDRSLGSMPAATWLEARLTGATVVLRSTDATDMLAAASSGLGLAVLPCFLGDHEPGLRRISAAVVARQPLYISYPREARISENVRALVRFLVDIVRQQADAALSGDR